uniref:Xylulose kinase-1 n=1 Tax=Tanacetum cinerariifolium TaxID=118510 RepID=A0A6L2NEG5_TANCI|nr:hypothetical protein [Tanacetum cinerariifolium]
MALTFAETHNMIAFLTKSDASEGFEQIINFLNAHVIKYALMVNPTIYVSCIMQFWTSVSIKKSNDVVRLKALIDRKKVIITEDSIRQALRLDDADSVDCLPNEDIFAELARMGYENPSTKLTFYKEFFLAQWKSLIHTILQCMSAKRTAWNEFSSSMASAVIYLATGGCIQIGGKIAELDADEDVTLEKETNEAEPTEVEEVIEVVTAAKLMTKVVTTTATTITTATPIIVALVPKASAPRKRWVEEPKPLKRQSQIEQDEAFDRELEAELNANINWNEVVEHVKRKERQDNTVMRYQSLKRKPVTEVQARKNMMVYLKNMVRFKMDFFKGMTYTEIRPISKKHFNSIWAFLEKGEKEIEEEERKRKIENLEQKAAKKQKINEERKELKTHLQIVPIDKDDVYTKATPLALKVPVVDYQIHHEHNKPYYKIIKADGTHQLFLNFITLLRNFDMEDLEMLLKLVQERFQSSEPMNFSDDFLLNTLKTMFEKPNVEATIWRN